MSSKDETMGGECYIQAIGGVLIAVATVLRAVAAAV